MHGLLRLRTHALHVAVEEAFAPFDLRDRDDYVRFLRAQAAAFGPLEAWLEASGIGHWLPDWPNRRRAALLGEDLSALGAEPPADVVGRLPRGAPLGVAYVLEGSRHGARSLLGLPRASADPAVRTATRFLGQPPRPGAWPALLAAIERHAEEPGRDEAILTGAIEAFDLFGRAAAGQARGRPAPAVERACA